MKYATIALLMLLSTLGPAIVIGLVGFGAVKSVARNPAASPKIFTAMIITFLFAEAIAVLALLVIYNLFN